MIKEKGGWAIPRFRLLKPLQLHFRFGKMGPKGNTVIFATFNRIVDTKTCIVQTEPNIYINIGKRK